MSRSNRLITRLTKGQEPAKAGGRSDDALVEAVFTRRVAAEPSIGETLACERARRLERLASSPTLAFLGVEEASLLFEALDVRARHGFDDDDYQDCTLMGERIDVQRRPRWIDEESPRFATSHGARPERSLL